MFMRILQKFPRCCEITECSVNYAEDERPDCKFVECVKVIWCSILRVWVINEGTLDCYGGCVTREFADVRESSFVGDSFVCVPDWKESL